MRRHRREARLRALLLGLLFAFGTALAVLLARERPATPLGSSLATPFQLLGAPIKLADRLASRVVPVGSVEERDLALEAARAMAGTPTMNAVACPSVA